MNGKVYYNEIESFPCNVIRNNIERGRIPAGFVDERDIREVNPDELVGYRQFHLFAGIGVAAYACRLAGIPDDFSIGTFGFPCQQISAAGKGEGLGTKESPTERSGLFYEAVRIFAVTRPTWLLAENVAALRTRGAATVIEELESIGYTVLDPVVVGADDVGAPHRRKRVWIVARLNQLANTEHDAGSAQRRAEPRQRGNKGSKQIAVSRGDGELANAGGEGLRISQEVDTRSECFAGRNAVAFGCDELANATRPMRQWNRKTRRRRFEDSNRRLRMENANRAQWWPPTEGRNVGNRNDAGRHQAPGRFGFSGAAGGVGQLGYATGTRAWPVSTGQWREGQRARDAHRAGHGMADSNNAAGKKQWRAIAVQQELVALGCNSFELRWPARPGEPQHEWEAPRTVESPLGRATDGPTIGLVRHIAGITGWTDVKAEEWWRRNHVRIAGRQRRDALKGLGNAWVPWSAVPILRWIYETEAVLQ